MINSTNFRTIENNSNPSWENEYGKKKKKNTWIK